MNMNQHNSPPGPPRSTPSMNQYSNPGMAQAQNPPEQRLPYHAEGWRKTARTCVILHMIIAALSCVVSIGMLAHYSKRYKKARSSGNTFIKEQMENKEWHIAMCILLPVFELTSTIFLCVGTGPTRSAKNPKGAMSKTIISLMIQIGTMLGKYAFINGYSSTPVNPFPGFAILDDEYVLLAWHTVTLAVLMIFFGVGVTYAIAIHQASKTYIILPPPQPDWRTVVPGAMNINPNLVAPMAPFQQQFGPRPGSAPETEESKA